MMIAALFALATVVMTIAIVLLIAVGARHEVDLDYQSGHPPSAVPVFLAAMILMAVQVALWFVMGTRYAGAW